MNWRKGIEEVITKRGEVVELKKGTLGGWRVVHPIRNKDGTWNLFNLLTGGSLANLIISGVLILLITLFLSDYASAIKIASECLEELGGSKIRW